MKTVTAALLLIASILIIVVAADAACRWTWDCSAGYPCRQVQLCDWSLDMPTMPPLGNISPIPPPTIRPIPPLPRIPPIGTSSCGPAVSLQ